MCFVVSGFRFCYVAEIFPSVLLQTDCVAKVLRRRSVPFLLLPEKSRSAAKRKCKSPSSHILQFFCIVAKKSCFGYIFFAFSLKFLVSLPGPFLSGAGYCFLFIASVDFRQSQRYEIGSPYTHRQCPAVPLLIFLLGYAMIILPIIGRLLLWHRNLPLKTNI